MTDREYKPDTKSTFKALSRRLRIWGYKETAYGDKVWNDFQHIGYAYYEKGKTVLRLTYEWVKNPEGRGWISGKMIELENIS